MNDQFVSELLDSTVCFSLSPNPLKTVLLFDELLQILIRKFSIESELLLSKSLDCVELCKMLIEKSGGKKVLLNLLRDTDLEGRSVFELIKSQHQLLPKIQTLVEGEWNIGHSIFSLDTFEVSSTYFLTVNQPESPSLFAKQLLASSKNLTHPLQFHFFRRSPEIKYQLNMLSVFMIAILSQIIVVDMRQKFNPLLDLLQNGGIPTPVHLASASEGLLYLRLFYLLCRPLSMCILLQSLLDYYYHRKKTGKCPSLLSASSLIDFSILASNIWIAAIQDYIYLEFTE